MHMFMASLSLLYIYWITTTVLPKQSQRQQIFVNTSNVIFITDREYLSIAIDTALIRNGWVRRKLCSTELIALTRPLAPAYLRMGGTAADQLIFVPNEETNQEDLLLSKPLMAAKAEHVDYCDYGYHCNRNISDTFNMTVEDWLTMNRFVKETDLRLLFDLNVLLRRNNMWDSTNAKKLLTVSTGFACNVSWQLGNEPNSFKHVFGVNISAKQLGKDFKELRRLLDEFPSCYKNSNLVGPDVTRPKLLQLPSASFMHKFLKAANGTVRAATFHQYYVNGRTAKLSDFLNTSVLDQLEDEINVMKLAVHTVDNSLPLWLTETSSAWGGGARGLSDTYAAGFMWLDKLGLAAKLGISLVIRQTLCGGHYSLIDCEKFEPHPDWWLSVLFKKLVGQKVFSVKQTASDSVRMYAHCANPDAGEGSVTLYGLNTGNEPVWLNIKGLEGPANAYILSSDNGLRSRSVLLNGKTLQLNKDRTLPPVIPLNISLDEAILIPGFSLGFWVTAVYKVQECYIL
ncbi:heparanase-like [Schistocerca cancellata]|uniref:heparanase-like n=1 Tax=Schistocerca cancellata TaxID=274614 RepID=UPI00211896E3|nr:heparanase-like [Schistocerca cancellata]